MLKPSRFYTRNRLKNVIASAASVAPEDRGTQRVCFCSVVHTYEKYTGGDSLIIVTYVYTK